MGLKDELMDENSSGGERVGGRQSGDWDINMYDDNYSPSGKYEVIQLFFSMFSN
jgi:hypothetical protein